MIIQHILRDEENRQLYTVREDDMTSPSKGYTQGYADQAGEDYAKYRAPEQIGDSTYTCLSSIYIRH